MSDPKAAIRELRARRAAATVEAVYKLGEDLLGRAQRLAPLEEGTLSASALLVLIVNGDRFEGASGKANAMAAARTIAGAGIPLEVDAEVSFNTIYAARQHEELDWKHSDGRQAKYLEQPFREQAARYERILTMALAAATRATI